MSIAAAAAQLVAALEAAGLRVAVRDGDLTPPCVYVPRPGTTSDAGVPLAGGRLAVFYVYYVPIRGVDNLAGDCAALDAIYDAVTPISFAEVAGTFSSVTVKNDSWPCYRLDVSMLGVPAALTRKE